MLGQAVIQGIMGAFPGDKTSPFLPARRPDDDQSGRARAS